MAERAPQLRGVRVCVLSARVGLRELATVLLVDGVDV